MGSEVRRLWMFRGLDYKAAENYLNRQAERGLLLKKIGPQGIIAAFDRDESGKKVRYCIDGCHGSKEEIEDYIAFAADGGWHHVATRPGMLIFASKPGEMPPPMQTDWQEEYRQIRRGLWKQDIPYGIICLIGLWLFFKLSSALGDDLIWDDLTPLACLYLLWMAAGMLLLLRALWFYIRSEAAIKRGRPLKAAGKATVRFWGGVHIAVVLFLVIAIYVNFGSAILGQMREGSVLSYVLAALMIVFAVFALLCRPKDEKHFPRYKSALIGFWALIVALLFVQCTTGL